MEVRARCYSCYRTVVAAVALLLFTSLPCRANDDQTKQTDPEAQAIAQLEAKANHANPREQCYLYTQLVQTMVEAAGHQMLAGDSERATATLKQTEHYTQLIHLALARDTKRLKDAEKMMEQTTQRMGEYLRHTSGDDHTAMQATLKQLDHVHDELLDQVFSH
jgi:Na+/phosphate symporter